MAHLVSDAPPETLREVTERLGHSDPAITLRVYSHVLPDQRTDLARVIGRVLDGKP